MVFSTIEKNKRCIPHNPLELHSSICILKLSLTALHKKPASAALAVILKMG